MQKTRNAEQFKKLIKHAYTRSYPRFFDINVSGNCSGNRQHHIYIHSGQSFSPRDQKKINANWPFSRYVDAHRIASWDQLACAD